MSYAVIVSIEIDGVEESVVKKTMDDLGWDGYITDIITGTVYFEGSGNICLGTSEEKQEKLIRDTFKKVMGKEIYLTIFFDGQDSYD